MKVVKETMELMMTAQMRMKIMTMIIMMERTMMKMMKKTVIALQHQALQQLLQLQQQPQQPLKDQLTIITVILTRNTSMSYSKKLRNPLKKAIGNVLQRCSAIHFLIHAFNSFL